ncbi:MAG: hypothetical protein JJU33_04805 [Phycisphaerales bacterium]|nr:hypothetical protein [Phycisphaerales bacterium]
MAELLFEALKNREPITLNIDGNLLRFSMLKGVHVTAEHSSMLAAVKRDMETWSHSSKIEVDESKSSNFMVIGDFEQTPAPVCRPESDLDTLPCSTEVHFEPEAVSAIYFPSPL